MRVGHDAAYMTRASRLFAPMDLSLPRPAEPPGIPHVAVDNSVDGSAGVDAALAAVL